MDNIRVIDNKKGNNEKMTTNNIQGERDNRDSNRDSNVVTSRFSVGIDVGHGNIKIAVKDSTGNNGIKWKFYKFPTYVSRLSNNEVTRLSSGFFSQCNIYALPKFIYEGKKEKNTEIYHRFYTAGEDALREGKQNICTHARDFIESSAYPVLMAHAFDYILKDMYGEEGYKDIDQFFIEQLGVGLPLMYSSNDELFKILGRMFFDNYKFIYYRNNKKVTIQCNILDSAPQGIAATLTPELQKYIRKYNFFGVVDIGQYTIDYYLIKDRNVLWNTSSTGTIEHGVNEFLNEIKSSLQLEGRYVSDDKCLKLMFDDKFKDLRFDYLEDNVISFLKKVWSNAYNELECICLLGGGAHLFKDFPNENFIIIEDAVYLNAKGYAT